MKLEQVDDFLNFDGFSRRPAQGSCFPNRYRRNSVKGHVKGEASPLVLMKKAPVAPIK